jgi:cell division protein FtsB
MLAFIPLLFPLVPLLIGAGAGAATVAACSNQPKGKNKAKIAALKARIEALERKP